MVAGTRRAQRQLVSCQVCGKPMGRFDQATCSPTCGYAYRRNKTAIRRIEHETRVALAPEDRSGRRDKDPTEDEIWGPLTAEIQAGWSPSERVRRSGVKRAKLLRLPDEVLFGRRR